MVLGAFVVASSAQSPIYRRPVIIRHYDPFWRGTLWDPYWGVRDPFYWDMRREYYDKRAVSDAQRKLAKDREKFYADGYLDPKNMFGWSTRSGTPSMMPHALDRRHLTPSCTYQAAFRVRNALVQ